MEKCPECGDIHALLGIASIECLNPRCEFFDSHYARMRVQQESSKVSGRENQNSVDG